MLNRKVIKKCHSTIAIDRTFTIALPEWNGCSLLSPCAFKNKPIQSYRSLPYECFWHKRC